MSKFKWEKILNKKRIRDYKINKKSSDCRDEFENDYGFIGKFKLNESNLDFELLEYSDTYSERDLEELKYYATKKIVENNFPESVMIAYG